MSRKFRARFDGKALIPIDPVDLPIGVVLDIEVTLAAADAQTISGPSLVQLRRDLPPLSPDAADEFDRAIDPGNRPMQ